MTSLAAAARASDAVKINTRLAEASHKIWGFVIYRCTYEDEVAWTRFKQIADERALSDLEESEAPQLLQSLSLKYFDDKEKHDGASKDQVREHFIQWCASDAAKAEHGDAGLENDTMLYSSPRYSYCVHVDAGSLASVINGPQPPILDDRGVGWVNLIDAAWEIPERETFNDDGNSSDVEIDDPTDEGEEPIDGCRLYDVGWMKMGAQSLCVPAYTYLHNPSLWMAAYKRPPEVWTR